MLARHLERIAEAVRRQQRGRRALALDQRIRHQRRRVHDLRELVGLALERVTQHGLDALRRRGGRAERLADRDDPVRAGDAQVGERPADIDAGSRCALAGFGGNSPGGSFPRLSGPCGATSMDRHGFGPVL